MANVRILAAGFVIVVDAYTGWCGPCENMIPTYNLLLRDVEECESRINFVTADRANFAEQLMAMIPEEAGIDIKTHGCEPLLLFIKGGKTVHYVKGANAGEVSRTAKEHLPPIGNDED